MILSLSTQASLTILGRSAFNGVFKSTDRGETWVPIADRSWKAACSHWP